MLIKALNAFSYVEDGEVFTVGHGETVTIDDDTLAQGFIDDGLAVAASLEITANGTYDVTGYASVTVSVG